MRPTGYEQWIEALGSDVWSERAGAATQIQALGDRAVPALIAGATHIDVAVRAASVVLMDHLGDARCETVLWLSLADPSPRVRRHAVHSIGCQGCKLVPLNLDVAGLLIERALHDTSARVRRVAIHQLGLQNFDSRIIAALQQILGATPTPRLKSRAEFALRQQEVLARA